MTNLIGQQLNSYRLTHFLGRGGFADVYLGEHIHLATQAAIKVLHERLIANDLDNFRQEAQLIAHLNHPNIVHILDFGINANGIPFLVMDYLPTGNILTVHPRGQLLPLESIVSFTRQVALALQHAHDARIIHRDVKPENLLLGPNQEIILSDFGIAVVAHRTASMQMQNITGTTRYMAPEQFRGYPTPASDQYSLGIMVYEWLCGECPFLGANFIEMGMKHTTDPVPPLRQKVPQLSPEVEQVVLTALAKEPQQRFSTIQAFATALEQASQWTIGKSTTLASPPLPRGQVRSPFQPTPPVLFVPTVPPTPQPGETLPVSNVALPPSQPVPMLHTPDLVFPPLQATSTMQTYEKTHPCPQCSQIDRIEKVSALVAGSASNLSGLLSFPEDTRTITHLVQLPRKINHTKDWVVFSCFSVLGGIGMFLSVLSMRYSGGLDVLPSMVWIAISSGITVAGLIWFTRTMTKMKQLKQEFGSHQVQEARMRAWAQGRAQARAQVYAFWDRLYYCARDGIVFVPGEPAWQTKPRDMKNRISQEYYSR